MALSDSNIDKPGFWTYLAHPGLFLGWSRHLLLPLVSVTVGLMGWGLYLSFFGSPPDYQMGDTVRMMYVHVPAAWLSQFCYAVMFVSAIGTLVWRHPMADVSQKAAAPLGAIFTALALFTGSMWGRPTWGTFWEWDGRMTSTLVLLFIYLGIIALWRAFDDQLKAARFVSIATLVGALNIPIIKFSVDWWQTLHQPASVVRLDGPTIAPEILTPLLVMTFAFSFMFGTLQLVRMRTEIQKRRIRTLELAAARAAGGAA